MADFLQELSRRVLVYDGAMGTNVPKHNLTADDFRGKEGCNELLVLSRPEDRGLDAGIINYAKIYPLYKIPEVEVDLARKLIFRDWANGDPLQVYMGHFSGKSKSAHDVEEPVENLSREERLKQLIIRGELTIGLGEQKQTLEEALESRSPLIRRST